MNYLANNPVELRSTWVISDIKSSRGEATCDLIVHFATQNAEKKEPKVPSDLTAGGYAPCLT